jgi:hypothetical protein
LDSKLKILKRNVIFYVKSNLKGLDSIRNFGFLRLEIENNFPEPIIHHYFMKKILVLTFLFCLSANLISLFCQAPIEMIGGNTKLLFDRRYRLTEEQNFNSGAVWSTQKANLNRPFDILTKVYIGDKNSGGDGIAFAFHQQKSYAGGGIPSDFLMGTLNPSLTVEIDTYNNNANNDPINDHIAIQKNGNFVHGSSNSLAGPINASSGFLILNVEDGDDHYFRITWNPATKNLKVYFDCQLRLDLTNDIVANIFNNDPMVYWGFSAACGSNNNRQEVEILRCSALDDYNEKILCDGAAPVEISASYGDSFSWSPSATLSQSNIRNPLASPITTTTYISTVQHGCSLTYRDTVKVKRPNLIPSDWTENAAICDSKKLILDATAPAAISYLWSDNSTNPTLEVSKMGIYKVTISDGTCTNISMADITVNPLPVFFLGKDFNFCDNTTVVLDATASDATYAWSTGSTNPKVSINKTGIYYATATTSKGCKFSDTISIVVRPSFKISESINICEGNSYTFQGIPFTQDTTLKANYTASNGCDSSYTLKIRVLKKSFGAIQARICQGSEYDFYGTLLKTKGIYNHNLVAKNGCDSVITLTLNVINSDTTKQSEFICKNASYTINNQTFTKDGVYPVKFTNSIGCDSFVILTLTVDRGLGYEFKDTICAGSSYTFDNKTLTIAGDYNQTLKNINGCDSIVTLHLFVKKSPTVVLTSDKQILCPNTKAILTASGDFISYNWSTIGIANKNIEVSQGGWYRVSVTDGTGCIGFDSVQIRQSTPIQITLLKKTPTCSGYADGQLEIKKIEGGIPPYVTSLDGNNFSNKLIYNNLKEGDYKVFVQDSAECETFATENLQNPVPKRIQIAQQSRLIQLGDSTIVTIVPSFKDVANVKWTPSADAVVDGLEAWLKPLHPTRFLVEVTDSAGCKFSDTVKIAIDSRLNLYVPNVFSANIDGTNDDIKPYSGPGVEKILAFRIFDRWGSMVFEALDFKPTDDIGWDGFYKGQRANEGVYLAHVKVLKLDGVIENVVSEVMLLR